MEKITLEVIKRAMPGTGRARINSNVLNYLSIEDQSEIVLTTESGASQTFTIFADTLVDDGKIRISEQDIEKLGITEGTKVVATRKIPLDEQIKKMAEDTATKIQTSAKGAADKIKESSTEAAEKIKEGSAEAAEKITSKVHGVSTKISEEITPIGEKIGESAHSGVKKIQMMLPMNRFSADVESALKSLIPEDEEKVRSMLLDAEESKAVIPVHAADGRFISGITLPDSIEVIAVQRGDAITFSDNQKLSDGDLVYLTGNEKDLTYMAEVLEG